MRNFFLIIRKYNFFIAFLLLQGISMYLLVKNNSYQREVVVSFSNQITGEVYAAYADVTDYLTLGITNRLLAEENARLRKDGPRQSPDWQNFAFRFARNVAPAPAAILGRVQP